MHEKAQSMSSGLQGYIASPTSPATRMGADIKDSSGRMEINCLVVVPYRVKILIPDSEIWYDSQTKRPDHVLRSMTGAEIDYVITDFDREGGCALASRRQALDIRRRAIPRNQKAGDKVPVRIVAVGRTRLLAEYGGFDLSLSQRDVSYAMVPDLREQYHPGEICIAVIKEYDREQNVMAVSIKEAEPHPFDGADQRHPVGSRRASVITGKYAGGVVCRLDNNLDCLCTYSQNQRDEDFSVGDEAIVVIRRYNYDKKQVYGKIIAKW